jgi:predicted ATP-binding protein involved in virulence
MRIDRLTVENFRCFKHQEFDFLPHFNLLAGDNGTGKTAVLEALALGMGSILRSLASRRNDYPFREKDAHVAQFVFERELTFEPQYPVRLKFEGELNQTSCSWARSKSDPDKPVGGFFRAPRLALLASELRSQVVSGEPVTLPVVAYFGTKRLWVQRTERSDGSGKATKLSPAASRLDGYVNALESASNDKTLFEWVKTQKLISLDEKQISAGFDCVKGAVATCLQSQGWDELDYRVRDDSLIVLKHAEENSVESGPTQLPFDYLSDGYRNTIAMVADIARRAFILNPQFGAEAALKTPGIVLIDELDLHLHPKWQRTIVDDLKRAFPLVQFFATSHSPFIIQSLEEGELLDLDPDENFPFPDDEYADKSIEDIAKYVMGTPGPQSRRTEEKEKVAMEYYRLLDEGRDASSEEVEQLKLRLDELEAPFSDDIAFSTFLKFQRETAHLGNGE